MPTDKNILLCTPYVPPTKSPCRVEEEIHHFESYSRVLRLKLAAELVTNPTHSSLSTHPLPSPAWDALLHLCTYSKAHL